MLPQYAITALLGRGGMGAVYRGTQKNLDRPVAIKILPPGIDEEDDGRNFSERFKNEARAMAKLSHPGIVAVYDSGETADGLLYIVMEFIEGTDVQKMVSEQKRLHSDHAMAITAHVCDALKYAHERGIIHRDIKPANIMVGYDGVVKVADFGLAKMSKAGESGLTRSGMAMGTLHYMAPEALMLGSSVDHRSDIYAVGVMLYFMLTGRLPQGMFELPSMQVPGLDPRFDGIIAKALRDDRDIRYQSTADLRRDLDGILTQPVVKVEPGAQQAPAALETQARPQRPAGQPYRPAQPQVIVRTDKKSALLLWVTLTVMSGAALWLWLKNPGTLLQATTDQKPHSMADSARLESASKERPYVNTLGMRFVPVPGTKVLMCVHETRRGDYAAFAKETPDISSGWAHTSFHQHVITSRPDEHPAAHMSWEEAKAFCKWLSLKEGISYRLPTKSEWGAAAGPETYAWGSEWPPPRGAGNFSDRSRKEKAQYFSSAIYFEDLDDGYPTTAPVMSYPANKLGIYDLAGNLTEWCEDLSVNQTGHLVSGGNWLCATAGGIQTSNRASFALGERPVGTGFRCVIDLDASAAGATQQAQLVATPAPGSRAQEAPGSNEWRPLLEDKPELVERLKITDAATPGWKLMPKGFVPVLDTKNVALRLKVRSPAFQMVAGWSETASQGIYGYHINLTTDATKTGTVRLFCRWIDHIVQLNGKIEPVMAKKADGAPSIIPFKEGQAFEIELRSQDELLVILINGQKVKEVRELTLPGCIMALNPMESLEFKDLEWCLLSPETVAKQTLTTLAPTEPPASKLMPGVWHNLFEKNLIDTNGLQKQAAAETGSTSYLSNASFISKFSVPIFRDCAVRARFSGSWEAEPGLLIHCMAPDSYQFISANVRGYSAGLYRQTSKQKAIAVTTSTKMEAPLLRNKSFEIELRAIGGTYALLVDGKQTVAGADSTYAIGHAGFRVNKGTVIESFEVMPFDGLSEGQIADALSANKTGPRTAAGAATPASPPVPRDTQNMKLVVDADFQQQQTAFPDTQTSKLHARWEDQSYRMTSMSNALWWAGPAALSALKLDDFVCEAEFRVPRAAAGKWGIGLVHPKMPWIGASTDAAGKAEIYRYDEAALLRATPTAASAAGGDWNKLRMEVVGEQLRLFINDRHVADASTAGLQKPHSLTLFLATPEPGFEVWLRRLKVWQPGSVAAATVAPVMPPVMPPPAAAPPDPLKSSLVHRFDFNDGVTPGSGKGAKVEDGELLVDGDYKHLGAVENRPLLACKEFQDEQFTIVLKLRHDRSEDALLVGGTSKRWLAVKTIPGGNLELSMANGRHQVRVYNANVPMKKPFVLAVSGNMKSGPIQIHVDGRPIKSVPVPPGLDNTSTGDKCLTFVNCSTTDTLKGAVDEVQVFKRILSDNEIASLMTPAKPPVPSASVAAGALPSWTDRSGRRITAQFVRVDDTTLTLRMNGRELPVALSSLSEESRLLAATFTHAAKPEAQATSFTNSLGMKFVPVPGTRVLFCIHETRYGDFAAFATDAKSTASTWKNQTYSGIEITVRKDEHPVTHVTPKQAVQFCAWLSQKEGKKYRLPTKEEWSLAANAGGKAPFPWGDAWPPPQGVGNFSDESYHKLRPTDPHLSGYDDGFPTTAPVMSFKPNGFGIYDLGGNVWEMTHAGDPAAAAFNDSPPMVDRGASFLHDAEKSLRSANESSSLSYTTTPDRGFRIVMEAVP